MESATFDLYRDIAERTDGDVYLGVVGPVRTGKSTFITRLMELLVMPKIPEGARKERIADELPQSGSGRTIMTTQPQFVPSEAVTVSLSDNAPVRVRLVDSVGYMVRGALGSVDKTGSRMVHTPWYDHDIPFEQAAEVGTRKVMTDHATIGVVVTTDGTIAELPRSAYIEAENRVVSELEALDEGHYLVQEVLAGLKKAGQETHRMRETNLLTPVFAACSELDGVQLEQLRPGEGRIDLSLTMKDGMFNRILGEECGTEIHGDKHLLRLMKELVAAKTEYDQIAGALKSVRETGYGLVSPTMAEMTMEAPEIVRQGGQFGIRLKAHAPSLHLIRVDIETEVTPTVGTEEQSEELARQMSSELESDPQKMWAMSFFGKPLSDMVREGLNGKLMRMPADAQEKVQETLTRIINDGDGGMICILL